MEETVPRSEENIDLLRITLVIVLTTSFLTAFTAGSINLAIPSMGLEFRASQFWLNWVVTSYLLTIAAFLLPFGQLADLIGRKKVFSAGMSLFTVTSLLCTFAHSIELLVIFRVLQGIASSMIFGTSNAILISVAPPQSRGKVLGLSAAAVYFGLSSGPVFGGVICQLFNWRGIFYICVLLSIPVLTLTLWKLKGEWKGHKERFDILGSVLCILGQILLLIGLGDLAKGSLYIGIFITGIAILIVFIVYELNISNPLLPLRIAINNRVFVFSNVAALISYTTTFGLTYLISLYLQKVLLLSTATAGLVLLAQPLVMAILSPFTGSLSDRIEPRLIGTIGIGISAVGLFICIFFSKGTPIVLVILNLLFIGIGLALFLSPNTNAIMGAVYRQFYGAASSTVANARLLGQALSMSIIALVTAHFMRNMTITSPDYAVKFMASFKISMIIFTILCIFGVLASLVRGKAVRAK